MNVSRTRLDPPALERQFRLDSLDDDGRRAVAIEAVWTLLFAVLVVNDLALLRGPVLSLLLLGRALVVTAGVVTIAVFVRSRRLGVRDATLFACIVLQVLFGLLVNATRARDLMPPVATSVVAILTVWALLPMPFRLQGLSAALVTASAVVTVAYLRRPLQGTEAVLVTLELALANAIGATVSMLNHRDRRGRWIAVRERVAAERELADARVKEVQAQLVRVQRAGGMGSLAVALAHELGQPLTAIRNSAFAARVYLERPAPDVPGALTALDGVSASAQRSAEIIERMRDYLRRGEVRREPVAPSDVAREAVALVAHAAAGQGVEVAVEVPPGLPAAWGDRVQLVQVAVIALVNAMDALSGREGPRTIRLGARDGGGGVEMGVDDSGPGIPQAVAERIFEPFFTTKENGMGMGLPIARTIVEAHGGSIGVGAAPGGGTRVRWGIPGRT